MYYWLLFNGKMIAMQTLFFVHLFPIHMKLFSLKVTNRVVSCFLFIRGDVTSGASV